ncbi:hypothetical protein P3X46_018425 [Hevea brasiliensis]|uniref:Uncharacterized protein n=1 Tax=Hevea brasiliensis TaxID=3981 RepID=A0ABQ9LSN5_HEVBR|nr:uncharacterized protein LOC131183763 [Hevea brasiliensis]KAJ9170308.1 hypothetical protein P3X46_018425 [Hevea brasiliensis]
MSNTSDYTSKESLTNLFKEISVDEQEQEIAILSILLEGISVEKLSDEEPDVDYRIRSFSELFDKLPSDSIYPTAFFNTHHIPTKWLRAGGRVRTFQLVAGGKPGALIRPKQSKS